MQNPLHPLGRALLLAAVPLLLLTSHAQTSHAQTQNTMTETTGCANSAVSCLEGKATITVSTSKGGLHRGGGRHSRSPHQRQLC